MEANKEQDVPQEIHNNQSPPPPPPPPLLPQFQIPERLYHQSPRQTALAERFTELAKGHESRKSHAEPRIPFAPCSVFFYGSLMDAEVLQTVLGLSKLPGIQEAKITGFCVKMWGIYPALVPREGSEVRGTTCRIEDSGQFNRLRDYETSAYEWCFCDIKLEDGAEMERARTFCWAGDPSSPELSDGSFDLEHYRKYFKQSVVRPQVKG